MIKKLPIVIDFQRDKIENNNIGKIIFHNFLIKFINNMIEIDVINPYNKLNFVKVPCVNKYKCIYYLKISLPLKIKIVNNKLLLPYYFVVNFQSNLNIELDFFSNLLISLKVFNKNFNYLSENDYEKNVEFIYSYLKNVKINNSFNNFSDYLKNVYIYTNYNLNFYLMLTYLNSKNVNLQKFNLSKKIKNNLNVLLNKKFKFKESFYYTIREHISNFKKKFVDKEKLVENNSYFFIINENKNFKVTIKKIINNKIYINNNEFNYDKYKISYYPSIFSNHLNYECLFNCFSKLNFNEFILNKLFNKNKLIIYKIILDYFTDDNFNINSLKECKKLELKIKEFEPEFDFINDNYLNKFYLFYSKNTNIKSFGGNLKNFTNKKSKIELLNFLFTKYTFPFKYNRRELDDTFVKIILFSLINYKLFVQIDGTKIFIKKDVEINLPIKLKSLYFNLIKIYHDYCNDSYDNIIYNPKLYTDPIHYDVLKIMFETNNPISNLFKYNKLKYNNLIETIKKVTLITQISSIINWRNVSKKLVYLDILINNNNFIFFNDKLNKNIVPLNFDNRLKKIILNPFEMFKYLRKEKDYIKWVYFLDKKIVELYNTTIIIKENQYEKLGKLIFLLLNIKNQDLKDDSYIYFLNYCNKNSELVLYNSRINLRIKECFKFLKININLGYMAKHLTWDNESIFNMNSNRIKNLEDKLKSLSKKYYKYKGKYIKLKRDTESSLSILSSKINND